MKYIKGQPRSQMTMVTECLEDYISEENPVRVIDAFVDSLDLNLAGFIRTIPKETGRPPYDPGDLLKLYVYGYFNKIRSIKKLMVECGSNIELFYLQNKLTPEFLTIDGFRKTMHKHSKMYSVHLLEVCVDLQPLSKGAYCYLWI